MSEGSLESSPFPSLDPEVPIVGPVEAPEPLNPENLVKRFGNRMLRAKELWTNIQDLAPDEDVLSVRTQDENQEELDRAFLDLFDIFPAALRVEVLSLVGDPEASSPSLDDLTVVYFQEESRDGSMDYIFTVGNQSTDDFCRVTFRKTLDASGKVHLSYSVDNVGRRSHPEREQLRKDFIDTAERLVPASLKASYEIKIPETLGEAQEPTDRNTLSIWYKGEGVRVGEPVELHMDFAQGRTIQIKGLDQDFPLEKKDSLIKVALFCSYISGVHDFGRPAKDYKEVPFVLDEKVGLKWVYDGMLPDMGKGEDLLAHGGLGVPVALLAAADEHFSERSFAEEIRMFGLTPEEVRIARAFMNHQWARRRSPDALVQAEG